MTRHVHIHLHQTRDSEKEGKWVTINGAHVFVGKSGHIEKGPKDMVGKHPTELEEHRAGRNSGRPSGKPYSPASSAKVARILQGVKGEEVPVTSIFKHPEAGPAEVLEAERVRSNGTEAIEMVNLSSLVPTQESVRKRGLLGYSSNSGPDDTKPMTVVAVGSKHYLMDGHHRAATMVLAGIDNVPLTVIREK